MRAAAILWAVVAFNVCTADHKCEDIAIALQSDVTPLQCQTFVGPMVMQDWLAHHQGQHLSGKPRCLKYGERET